MQCLAMCRIRTKYMSLKHQDRIDPYLYVSTDNTETTGWYTGIALIMSSSTSWVKPDDIIGRCCISVKAKALHQNHDNVSMWNVVVARICIVELLHKSVVVVSCNYKVKSVGLLQSDLNTTGSPHHIAQYLFIKLNNNQSFTILKFLIWVKQ